MRAAIVEIAGGSPVERPGLFITESSFDCREALGLNIAVREFPPVSLSRMCAT